MFLLLGLPFAVNTTPVSTQDLPSQLVADTGNTMAQPLAVAEAARGDSPDDFSARLNKKVGEKAVQRAEKFGLAAGTLLGAKIGFSVAGPLGGVLGGLLGEALGSVLGEQFFLPPSTSPWRR